MKEMLIGVGRGSTEYEHPYGDRFLGEVPASAFITGDTLASRIGLTQGTSVNSNEGWFKFITGEGLTLYVSKRRYRDSLGWSDINNRGAVFGTRTVTIQGDTYKVRLLKGASSNPMPALSGSEDPSQSWGSEWNRLLYPLVSDPDRIQSHVPTYPISGEGIEFGAWRSYNNSQLDFNYASVCQEASAIDSGSRVMRGGARVTRIYIESYRNRWYSWRPVLELVE